MYVVVVLPVVSATLSFYVAALSRRFSLAPGWRDQLWFSGVALSAGAYAVLNVPIALSASPAVTVGCSQIQLLLAAVHVACWVMYSAAYLREPLGRVGRWTVGAAVGLALSALVPGLLYRTGVMHVRKIDQLSAVYHDPVPTRLGDAAFMLILAGFIVVGVRFAVGARRRVPHAMTHLLAIIVLLAMVANDVLSVMGVIRMPYLVDLGIVAPVGVVGYVITSRFSADARTLAELRVQLEATVEGRTEELTRAHAALLRSENLAAVGQLAAGVAHEVNNPAAVVAANLRYLEDHLQAGCTPDDALECVQESGAAVRRITSIVRQLLDAGRAAATRTPPASVAVAAVARDALRTARPRCPSHVSLTEQVPEDLWALADENRLQQVLVNLVVNGAQAVPEERTGKVEIHAQHAGGRVLVTVEDDGAGMDPEVLQHVFEPFFTTKPFGAGSGLGLAVSRGLVASLGGDLRIESQAGRGTRAVVELPEAKRAPSVVAPAPDAPGRAARVLVVDDDPMVLTSMGRLLRHYSVEVASGVDDGLRSLATQAFDIVLCDLMMPAGGGERLYRELRESSPKQAARVVFITGGATTEEARRYLALQGQPVLEKPIDLHELTVLLDRIAETGDAAPRPSWSGGSPGGSARA